MKLELWKRFTVTLGIKNRIVGGVPTDPNLIAGWIKAFAGKLFTQAVPQTSYTERPIAEDPTYAPNGADS